MGFLEGLFPQRAINGMCLAASYGELEVVKEFVQSSVDINGVHEDGCTALMLAAGAGHLEIVKYLVSQGAEINKIDGVVTALDLAIISLYNWESEKISGGRFGKDKMLERLNSVMQYLTRRGAKTHPNIDVLKKQI
jgi:ankyrin repeat protein